MSERPGLVIAIEGGDGVGKTTQLNAIQTWLGHRTLRNVMRLEEPGTTEYGMRMRSVILNRHLPRSPHTNPELFTDVRREMWNTAGWPTIALGGVALYGRTYISTLAYQGYDERLDPEYIEDFTRSHMEDLPHYRRYLQPDATIILDVNEDVQAERLAKGRTGEPDFFEHKKQESKRRIRDGYRIIASEHDYPLIDTSFMSPDEVTSTIQEHIEPHLAASAILS